MKKIIAISILIVLISLSLVNIIQATEQTDEYFSLLVITEDSALSGDSVTEMISDIGKAYDLRVTNVQISSGSSLENALTDSGIYAGITYTDVILQDSYDNLFNSNWDAIKELKQVSNSNCYVGTPWKELTEQEKDKVTARLDSLVSGSSIKSLDRVYTNLLAVKASGIEIANSTGNLTNAGKLTLACTYITEITKIPLSGLTSYNDVSDNSVKIIVDKVNSNISGAVIKKPSSNQSSTQELSEETDLDEFIDNTSNLVNREPIAKFICDNPNALEIQIYDKEQAGIKRAEIRAESTSGDLVQEANIKNNKDGKEGSYKLKIDSKKYLKEQEYKKFYIVAEDNDGCVLEEYFKVKLLKTSENGSYYKINRAPRVRPKLTDDETKEIALAVQDSTGVMSITPKTVAAGNYKETNLYADGKYNGFSGVTDTSKAYKWQSVISKTSTGSNTYIKDAKTEFVAVEDFFKVDKTKLSSSDKVLINVGNNNYKFKVHTKDATGLVSEKTMILSLGKDDVVVDDADDPSNNTNNTNSKTNANNTNKTSTTKKTTETGTLKADPMSVNYLHFKSDREPRIEFLTNDPDCVYLKFKDCCGIKCEHTGDKVNQPKVYTCSNNKGKDLKEITDLKRPTLAQYKKQGTEYVYIVGIPAKYLVEDRAHFYAVAYDSDKYSNVIREYFDVIRKEDGSFHIDRSPRSVAVTTEDDMNKIGFLTTDYSGIGTIKVRTIKDKGIDTLGEWNGTISNNWSQVESITMSRKYMTSSITTMTKVSTFFKNRNWAGKNPKISGSEGVYRFAIDTIDSIGMTCSKTMVVDTTKYQSGIKHDPISTTKKQEPNIDVKKFYYNQLDSDGKKIYDEFDKNIENLKTGTYTIDFGTQFKDRMSDNGTFSENKFNSFDDNTLRYVTRSFVHDDAEKGFVRIYSDDNNKNNYANVFTASIYTDCKLEYGIFAGYRNQGQKYINMGDKNDVNSQINTLRNTRNNVVNNVKGESDYEKVKYVHDYIMDTCTYVFTDDRCHVAYGTLIDKKCVCEGYAMSFKYLLDGLNIPCILVEGEGKSGSSGGNHAWNYVYLNGKWYAVDSTWDDNRTEARGKKDYSYFLKGSKAFNKDHTPNKMTSDSGVAAVFPWNYPTLSTTDYSE